MGLEWSVPLGKGGCSGCTRQAGMNIAESDAVVVRDLQYVVATAACHT